MAVPFPALNSRHPVRGIAPANAAPLKGPDSGAEAIGFRVALDADERQKQ